MNASNIPAGTNASADGAAADPAVELAELRETLTREQETNRKTADFYSNVLSKALTPDETLRLAVIWMQEYLVGMGIADKDIDCWAYMYENTLGFATGWSSEGADAEAAAIAHEEFELKLATAIVPVPDAHTYVAVPLPDLSGRNPAAGVISAVAMPGTELHDNILAVSLTIATSIVMHIDRVRRINDASLSTQYAQAAARAQTQLTEPIERVGALRIAIEALSHCEDLVGGIAVERIDGEPNVVAEFGQLDRSLAMALLDGTADDAARASGKVMLPIALDGQEEATIILKSRTAIDSVEDEMLASIGAAVAGSIARYRATGTIESLRRSATRRLVEAQERERSMVAADIHDGVLQQLGATAIRLELAQARVEQRDFDTATAIIEDGAKEIRSCARELRALLMELRPQVLDDNGLSAALAELGRHVEGVDVTVTSDVRDDLGNEFSITIFRIVQEALTNIQKHAQATTANVDVKLKGDVIYIEIRDNGIGYEGAVTGPSAEGSHLGLLGMRERARMLGGRFSINGESGGGTLIEATLPLSGSVGSELEN